MAAIPAEWARGETEDIVLSLSYPRAAYEQRRENGGPVHAVNPVGGF